MSRAIRFRAWHKQEQKMYPVVGTFYNLVSLSSSWDAVDVSQDIVTVIGIDTVELMQFTGLSDKHGKPIYEGDIIRCYDGPLESHFNSVIEWQIRSDISSIPLEVSGFIIGNLSEVEIIGNVHENPELLKD